MRQVLAKQLRNALNPVRSCGDEIEVQQIRESTYGLSTNILIIASTLLFCGISTYMYLPRVILFKQFDTFTFYVNLLLLLTIMGLILVSQSLIPTMERWILNIMIFLRPSDRKIKPIISQNLESHGKRNMKTSLMFTVTVSFLVLSAANLQQIQFFLVAITKSFFGSDIRVFRRMSGDSVFTSVIDEFGMTKFVEENMVSVGGII